MKITPKFQLGGNLSSLFTIYTPIQTPRVLAPTSVKSSDTDKESLSIKSRSKSDDTDKEDSKGKLTEKDLFLMVKDVNGLDNEMRSIISSLKDSMLLQRLTGADTGELQNTFLDNLYKLKVTNQNKEKLDNAIKTAQTNGSLGEAAITLEGNLLVMGKDGKSHQITLEQYQQNRDAYLLLTNSNVAWLRKYSPKEAFAKNDNSFEIIDNGMGYESFQKLLDLGKTSLGSYKYEELGVAGKEALNGLNALSKMSKEEKQKVIDSIDGNVNYTTETNSNVLNIAALVEYLNNVLPKRAKVWAAVKTNLSYDTAAKELIKLYLLGSVQSDQRFVVNEQKKKGDSNGSGSDSGGNSSFGKIEANAATRFLMGQGVQNLITLSPGTSRAIQVRANTMPLTKANGDPVGANTPLLDAVNGQYAGILDIGHATIAGQPIDTSAFGGIILKDGKISSMDLPCSVKSDGSIIPSTSKENFEAVQAANTYLMRKGINVSNDADRKKYWEVINKVYKKYGLEEAYNNQGELKSNWRRFGVINVVASDKALGLGDMDDNPLLKEVTDDSTIDNLIQLTKDTDFSKKGFFNSITGSYNRFYEGTMFIPLDVNYLASTVTSKINMNQAEQIEQRQQALDVRKNWVTPPSI